MLAELLVDFKPLAFGLCNPYSRRKEAADAIDRGLSAFLVVKVYNVGAVKYNVESTSWFEELSEVR